MSTVHGVETEVKIRLSDTAAAQSRLAAAGFTVSVPRRFESNTVYDTAGQTLKNAHMLLRLRQTGGESLLTWKGPYRPGPHKSRPELETTVGSPQTFDQILRALGYHPAFRYEKYRSEFKCAAAPAGTVTLDETPIGDFLELEGPADWIDHAAALLGFDPGAYVLDSYIRLYFDHCAAKGLEPSNMVFPPAP